MLEIQFFARVRVSFNLLNSRFYECRVVIIANPALVQITQNVKCFRLWRYLVHKMLEKRRKIRALFAKV